MALTLPKLYGEFKADFDGKVLNFPIKGKGKFSGNMSKYCQKNQLENKRITRDEMHHEELLSNLQIEEGSYALFERLWCLKNQRGHNVFWLSKSDHLIARRIRPLTAERPNPPRALRAPLSYSK